jgi:hypothetical protein
LVRSIGRNLVPWIVVRRLAALAKHNANPAGLGIELDALAAGTLGRTDCPGKLALAEADRPARERLPG